MANTINHTESLKDYLKVQLEETYDEIRWCETHNTPVNEARVSVLNYRKAWLLQQLNNTYFTQAEIQNKTGNYNFLNK